jgi:hypothetical protein
VRFNTNLAMEVRVPVREVHEIEFTSRCNLACRYCPHPKMVRPKADMTRETFDRTMLHLQHLCDAGTQGEVSLTGIGEAILHPEFVPWMRVVREAIGPSRRLVLATNGVAMTPELAKELAKSAVTVYVSTHRPERAGPAVQMVRAAGCTWGTNTAFVDDAIDWAGQVPWHVSAGTHLCSYLDKRWVAIRQDGSVNTCCMDAESLEPIGSVYDALGSLHVRTTKDRQWPIELVTYLHDKRMREAAA